MLRNDGREAGEFAAVMYNSARFDCVESGFFWLSETPLVPGSTAWGARVPRMATWLLLEDKCTPSLPPVLFINTHIDHESARARVEACKLLLQATKLCHPHADVILTGMIVFLQ